MMPRLNRIIGFASVSFLLLFVAKINKVELYTAYFRTIADVEVRNSQGIPQEGVVAISAAHASEMAPGAGHEGPSSFALGGSALDLGHGGETVTLKASCIPEAPLVRLPLIPQTSPRAPGHLA